mmetsp:Transcript_30930/g.27356  ORF Transcript_30930/g.27356 Transcript_30930/m.27356 type:complete len:153 (+) Transcript_30930:138-596(+)
MAEDSQELSTSESMKQDNEFPINLKRAEPTKKSSSHKNKMLELCYTSHGLGSSQVLKSPRATKVKLRSKISIFKDTNFDNFPKIDPSKKSTHSKRRIRKKDGKSILKIMANIEAKLSSDTKLKKISKRHKLMLKSMNGKQSFKLAPFLNQSL